MLARSGIGTGCRERSVLLRGNSFLRMYVDGSLCRTGSTLISDGNSWAILKIHSTHSDFTLMKCGLLDGVSNIQQLSFLHLHRSSASPKTYLR